MLGYVGRQASGFRVVRLTGGESEIGLPFAALHQLCLPMLDMLPALREPQSQALQVAFGLEAGTPPDRFVVGLAVLHLLCEAASRRPIAVLVDDVQWLDAPTAQVLGFVGRRLTADPIFLLRRALGGAAGPLGNEIENESDGARRLETSSSRLREYLVIWVTVCETGSSPRRRATAGLLELAEADGPSGSRVGSPSGSRVSVGRIRQGHLRQAGSAAGIVSAADHAGCCDPTRRCHPSCGGPRQHWTSGRRRARGEGSS